MSGGAKGRCHRATALCEAGTLRGTPAPWGCGRPGPSWSCNWPPTRALLWSLRLSPPAQRRHQQDQLAAPAHGPLPRRRLLLTLSPSAGPGCRIQGGWAQRGLRWPCPFCKHDTDHSFAQTYCLQMEAGNLGFLWPGPCPLTFCLPCSAFPYLSQGTCGGGAVTSEEGSGKVTAGSKSSVNTTSLADWPSLLLFDLGDGCRAGRLRFHRRGLGVSGRLLDLSRVCSGGGTPPTSHQPQGRGRCFILSGEPRPPQRAPGLAGAASCCVQLGKFLFSREFGSFSQESSDVSPFCPLPSSFPSLCPPLPFPPGLLSSNQPQPSTEQACAQYRERQVRNTAHDPMLSSPGLANR